MRSNDFFQRINCTMKNSFGKIKRIFILIYRNHRCHISWNILYTVSLLYGLFNFLPQSSLATGKSSVSREIFRIPRGNLFLSFDQQREAFLPTMDTRVCSDGLVYVRLTGPYESLGESQRSFCWLRSSLLFSWRTARKPDRCFFFSFFFGSAISPTRLSNTNHSIGRAWHRTFPPRLFDPSDPVSSLHVWHPLYAWSVCPAFVRRTRESKGKRFRGFRTTSLIYSNKLARNLEKEQERYLRDLGKDRIISTSNNNLGLTVESNKLNWLIDFFINKFNYDKYADIFGKIN